MVHLSGQESLVVDGVGLEYQMVGPVDASCDLVFLHEGLGSISLWRGFPARIADRLARRGVVYSRRGHGSSSPSVGRRPARYLHHEALEVLPRVMAALVDGSPILVGHSDGASIAIIAAGAGIDVAAIVLIAPHVFVEPEAVAGIDAVVGRYRQGDLSDRLARHHQDADALFWAWADIWRSPEFADWSIEEYLPSISCPTLIIQAEDDEYATIAQPDRIAAGMAVEPELLWLPSGGHSPHLTVTDPVSEAIVDFVERSSGGGSAA